MTEKVNTKTDKNFLLGYYQAIQDLQDLAEEDGELSKLRGAVWHLREKARDRSYEEELLALPTYDDGYKDAYVDEVPARLIYESDPDYYRGYSDGTDRFLEEVDD